MDAADADLAPFRDWLLVLPRQIPGFVHGTGSPENCPSLSFNVVM